MGKEPFPRDTSFEYSDAPPLLLSALPFSSRYPGVSGGLPRRQLTPCMHPGRRRRGINTIAADDFLGLGCEHGPKSASPCILEKRPTAVAVSSKCHGQRLHPFYFLFLFLLTPVWPPGFRERAPFAVTSRFSPLASRLSAWAMVSHLPDKATILLRSTITPAMIDALLMPCYCVSCRWFTKPHHMESSTRIRSTGRRQEPSLPAALSQSLSLSLFP